jgi:hypothetical protein
MGSNHTPTPWNTERDAFLTDLHGQADEPSFSIMAAEINKKFGTVFTRNSLIGRASRIKLAKRLHKVNSKFEKQTLPRKPRQPPKPRQRYVPESKRMMTIFESREVLELQCAEVEPLNISLLDLKPHHCRWPYGEGREILSCGHPKNDVSSYCELHFALSKRRMT